MLIEFTVGNYLSFKEPVTFSLEASEDEEFRETNVFSMKKYDLLKSAVIYGANSSGKSNLLKALSKMQSIVLTSFNKSSNSKLDIVPFLLHVDTENKSSYFQIKFSINKIVYTYGFEIDNNKIHKEWLTYKKHNQENQLFSRIDNKITVLNEFIKYKEYVDQTRENALFLNVIDRFNNTIAKDVIYWFENQLVIGFRENFEYINKTKELAQNSYNKQRLLKLFQLLNLGFIDLNFLEEDIKQLQSTTSLSTYEFLLYLLGVHNTGKHNVTKTIHNKYDLNNSSVGFVELDLIRNESSGTRFLVNLSGVLLNTLDNGKTLIIDELDASLHQLLTLEIIKLFHSKETNPNNAQLIFTTHDASLLKKDLLKDDANFRNDQVYFVEKDKYEASKLTSLYDYDLSDLKHPIDFEKNYLLGRFGAIPYIDSSTITLSSDE